MLNRAHETRRSGRCLFARENTVLKAKRILFSFTPGNFNSNSLKTYLSCGLFCTSENRSFNLGLFLRVLFRKCAKEVTAMYAILVCFMLRQVLILCCNGKFIPP